jgi:hypothetical protein
MGIGPRAVHACASPAWRSCVCWPRKGSVGVAGSAATRGGAGFGNEPGRANQEGAPGRDRWTGQGHRCAPHRPGSQSLPLYDGPRPRRRLYGTAHGVRRDAPHRSWGAIPSQRAARSPEATRADPFRGAPPGSPNRPPSVR